jgi:putative DNA modification/repair radical SAM protein
MDDGRGARSAYVIIADKLRILADGAKYDASCASSGVVRKGTAHGLGNSDGSGICHSYTPDGRCVSLLKILLTNYCIYDCQYCVNRLTSDVARARFSVREVVDLTLEFYRRNYIEGLFLSSGIIQSPDYTTEQLVDVARRLRLDHAFGGYIHLKLIPGAARELVAAAGVYADRVSANIELPTRDDLSRLAPEKTHEAVEGTMAVAKAAIAESDEDAGKTRHGRPFAPAGQTTQMIVGATASTDADILATASHLYDRFDLRRVYYTAFSPFPYAPEWLGQVADGRMREHRLYQADWLIRHYHFTAAELTTASEPNLPSQVSPKLAWALRHPGAFPVDVNTAPRERLLRIPGIGYRTVERLLRIRRHHRIALADLSKLRVRMSEARYFVVTADSRPTPITAAAFRTPEQQALPW